MNEDLNQPNTVNPAPEPAEQLPEQEITPTQPEMNKKSPVAAFQGIFGKFRNIIFSDRTKVILPRVLVIAIFLIVLSLAVPRVLKMIKTVRPTPTPAPTEAPSPTSEILSPSVYANDEEVLAIEKSIQDLEGQLQIVNFREDTLMIPSVDWDVNFK
jgi:hypothetical protein